MSKAFVTRRRNQKFRGFLSKLSGRKLSADDTQREISSYQRAHGLSELRTQPVEERPRKAE